MVARLAVFGALADATRLRILALLREMELSVGELAQVMGQSQPRVSHHVKILAEAGLCNRRREGSWVFLGLGPTAEPALLAAIDSLPDPVGDRWKVADAARLEAVRADRMAAAELFFNARAEEWDAIRSLHVAEAEVERAIVSILGDVPVGRLVDIGTGTGRMIELLGPGAETITGIDRSPEMLRLARAKTSAAGLARTDLRQGDMYALPVEDAAADTVILHQVLHYAQAPAAAIAEAARLLPADGRLLIVDFAAHQREDLRQRDAHVRLGFDEAQIGAWFEAAGLTLASTDALGGGELTVKLWLGMRKADTRHLKVVA
jgi:ubiquinone/menaquinone biosynthesis C-methylase UbiE